METTKEHVFYVLECVDGTFYAGYTNNLQKRVKAHNAGKGAKYTRAKKPVHCIYFEEFDTKQEALKAEYAFKQLNRSEKEIYVGREEDEITKEFDA